MKKFPNDYVADACPDPSDVARSYCGAFSAYKRARNIYAAHRYSECIYMLIHPFLIGTFSCDFLLFNPLLSESILFVPQGKNSSL